MNPKNDSIPKYLDTDLFAAMIGQIAWNAKLGLDRTLTVEFGNPSLRIREPVLTDRAVDDKVKGALEKRTVTLVGEWHIWIQFAEWEITIGQTSVKSYHENQSVLTDFLEQIDGQKITGYCSRPENCGFEIIFDLGLSLKIAPMDAGPGCPILEVFHKQKCFSLEAI